MSGGYVFFQELIGQALASTVKPNSGGVLRTPEDHPDLSMGQVLPNREPQDFVLVRRQPRHRGKNGMECLAIVYDVVNAPAARTLKVQSLVQRVPSPLRAPLIRDRAAGDREEPRPDGLVRRRIVDPAPSNGEDIGDDLLGVSEITRATQGIGEDVSVLGLEEPAEVLLACSRLHECPVSGQGRIFRRHRTRGRG
jgi:hypothetical protein